MIDSFGIKYGFKMVIKYTFFKEISQIYDAITKNVFECMLDKVVYDNYMKFMRNYWKVSSKSFMSVEQLSHSIYQGMTIRFFVSIGICMWEWYFLRILFLDESAMTEQVVQWRVMQKNYGNFVEQRFVIVTFF